MQAPILSHLYKTTGVAHDKFAPLKSNNGESMLLENQKIAILGAGPVGLTIAKLLQQKGVAVVVYERDQDAHARVWGGTLDLHEDTGQKALRQAGLLETYFALAKPMGRTLTDEQGNVLLSTNPQHGSPEINRNNLRQLLLDSLPSDTVVWDRKFTGLEVREGKWLVHFENAPTAPADVVIGANGGMSKARAYVTAAEAEYTETFIVQGEVPQPEITCPGFYRLCNDNILMAAGEGNTLVANPHNNGALTYNVTFRRPEAWLLENGLDFHSAGSISAFLLAMFAEWGEPYKQLFRATATFVGLPARELPLDKPWKTNRPLPITLVGDAAHIMPPFAGQGLNIGLLDALVLSDNLTGELFNTVAAAIADYEQKMVVYAQAAQLETGQNELAMHRPGFSFQQRFSSQAT